MRVSFNYHFARNFVQIIKGSEARNCFLPVRFSLEEEEEEEEEEKEEEEEEEEEEEDTKLPFEKWGGGLILSTKIKYTGEKK